MTLRRSKAAVVAAAVVLIAAAFLLGRLSSAQASPGEGSVDIGFARDMSHHHEQAVLMGQMAFDRSDDAVVKALGYDIALSQQYQIGVMQRWLGEWDVPAAGTGTPMAWMEGHGGHIAEDEETMAGMATQEELDDLSERAGAAFDQRFLELMIDHHVAGIDMASYAAEHAESDEVRELATTMVDSQRNEVTMMKDMLGS